jgi:hypothetical protein
MIKILLLDCWASVAEKLIKQGYDVETGTIGFATGVRILPSQLYEKQVFFYSPNNLALKDGRPIEAHEIQDFTPEYKLEYLEDSIRKGGTFVVFVNQIIDDLGGQNLAYGWIPFMPQIQFTKDQLVVANPFDDYPDHQCRFLAPVVGASKVEVPVLQKLVTPQPRDYPRDIFTLFGNANGEKLGAIIIRERGSVVVLPKMKSNEEAIATFIQRVLPNMYDLKAQIPLIEKFVSPAETRAAEQVAASEATLHQVEAELEGSRVALATARREKSNMIQADPTAKQILHYYDTALRQDDMALFFLYKVVELIENKHGGESSAIKKFGLGTEWKFLKKVANASYGDIRHAPKPGDVIQAWSDQDLKDCFDACEKITLAYFNSLFP